MRVKRASGAQQLIGQPGRVRPGEREIVGDPGFAGADVRAVERPS